LSQALSFQEAVEKMNNEIDQNLKLKLSNIFSYNNELLNPVDFKHPLITDVWQQLKMSCNLEELHKNYTFKSLVDCDCAWKRYLVLMSRYLNMQD